MKLKSLYLMLIMASSILYANADGVKKSKVLIDKISIGKFDGDIKPEEFSINIDLTNTGKDIDDWKFGFYLPRTFNSLSAQNINPNLNMQICSLDGNCTNLRYVKSASVTDKDISQGYFTVLEPVEKFILQKKSGYIIKLMHNNQWGANNFSAVPQSLFIMQNEDNNEAPTIYPLITDATNYNLLGHDQDMIEDNIKTRIDTNWTASQAIHNSSVKIIPEPVRVREGVLGDYTLSQNTIIHNQLDDNNTIINQFSKQMKQDLGFNVDVDNASDIGTGILITSMANPIAINNNPEGYRLSVTSDGVIIEALTQTGVYYAFQTLRQMYLHNSGKLPAVTIIDYPQFKYRGVLLDVARHYFSVSEIKQLIDVMASAKLNTLHLHLSDDEAFRIALAEYPTLTTIGATRGLGQSIGPNMLIQNNLDTTNLSQVNYPLANTPYSGSYSNDDITNIIHYANANQITIIPEIDIPGHARALIKSLPDSMVDMNDNSQYMSVQGYTDNVLPVCTYDTDISVGKQFTRTIDDIVNRTAKLFENQTTIYNVNNEISVAADEVSHNAWTNDSSCRNDWASLTALDKSQLFLQKMADKNSDLVFSGWQQMVQHDDGKVNTNVISAMQSGHIWVWNPTNSGGIKQAVALANANYPVVLAFADKTYFDLAYNPSMTEPGFTWAGKYMDTYNTLDVVRSATEVTQTSVNPQNILGIEGALWSENLASFDHLMYMALPKLPALAEASWSQNTMTLNNNQLNWQDFATRLGCGESGFIAMVSRDNNLNYRGYPDGIAKEVPLNSICSIKSDVVPTEK